jgi:general secretion pathway protein C
MHGDERLAVIEDASGTQRLHRAGEIVDGATIAEVTWDGVVLEARGRRTRLPLETRPDDAVAATEPSPAPPATPAEEIRQVSADSFLVERDLLLGEVGNMSALLAQLRAVPEVEAGEPIGFRVFSISEDSIFRRLGLRDGDVVRRVNGSTLHDPAALLTFLQGMGNESRIALDLVRSGEPATLVYDLR